MRNRFSREVITTILEREWKSQFHSQNQFDSMVFELDNATDPVTDLYQLIAKEIPMKVLGVAMSTKENPLEWIQHVFSQSLSRPYLKDACQSCASSSYLKGSEQKEIFKWLVEQPNGEKALPKSPEITMGLCKDLTAKEWQHICQQPSFWAYIDAFPLETIISAFYQHQAKDFGEFLKAAQSRGKLDGLKEMKLLNSWDAPPIVEQLMHLTFPAYGLSKQTSKQAFHALNSLPDCMFLHIWTSTSAYALSKNGLSYTNDKVFGRLIELVNKEKTQGQQSIEDELWRAARQETGRTMGDTWCQNAKTARAYLKLFSKEHSQKLLETVLADLYGFRKVWPMLMEFRELLSAQHEEIIWSSLTYLDIPTLKNEPKALEAWFEYQKMMNELLPELVNLSDRLESRVWSTKREEADRVLRIRAGSDWKRHVTQFFLLQASHKVGLVVDDERYLNTLKKILKETQHTPVLDEEIKPMMLQAIAKTEQYQLSRAVNVATQGISKRKVL